MHLVCRATTRCGSVHLGLYSFSSTLSLDSGNAVSVPSVFFCKLPRFFGQRASHCPEGQKQTNKQIKKKHGGGAWGGDTRLATRSTRCSRIRYAAYLSPLYQRFWLARFGGGGTDNSATKARRACRRLGGCSPSTKAAQCWGREQPERDGCARETAPATPESWPRLST